MNNKPSVIHLIEAILILLVVYLASYSIAQFLAGPHPQSGFEGLMPALFLSYMIIPLITFALGLSTGVAKWKWWWSLIIFLFNSFIAATVLFLFFNIDGASKSTSAIWYPKYSLFVLGLAVGVRILVEPMKSVAAKFLTKTVSK